MTCYIKMYDPAADEWYQIEASEDEAVRAGMAGIPVDNKPMRNFAGHEYPIRSTDRLEAVRQREADIRARLRATPAALPEDRAHDHVGPADDVHRRANDVIGDLINGRIGLPTRRALRDAVDKLDKIPEPKSFPGRALRIEAMAIGVRLP